MSHGTQQVETAKRPLPAGWRWVKLGEVCEIIPGQSPPSETYRKTPEGLPFFQGKADFGTEYPVPSTWCVAPQVVAKPGDILISVRAPVGPTNVANVECCIGRGLAAIRPSELVDGVFIQLALKFLEPDLIKLGSGSTFQAIRRQDLEMLGIPLPPLREQKRIAGILREQMASVERLRKALEEQLEAINKLPSALLRKAFNGEL
jgi:type I restriction enzyme S subunit